MTKTILCMRSIAIVVLATVAIVFGSHFDCCYPGLSIKEKYGNANDKIKLSFLLLLEIISLSCKDTDAGTIECEEANSTCLVKRVGNFF
jgi:hypothetical protein